MNVYLGVVDTGCGLNKSHQLLLHAACDADNIAAVKHRDDSVNYDLRAVHKLHLYAAGHGLEAEKLRKLRSCGVGKAGNAVNFGNSAAHKAGDNVLRDIDTAVLFAAGDIIFAHNVPPKFDSEYSNTLRAKNKAYL